MCKVYDANASLYVDSFPPVVYPSSNWGGYLYCAHGYMLLVCTLANIYLSKIIYKKITSVCFTKLKTKIIQLEVGLVRYLPLNFEINLLPF